MSYLYRNCAFCIDGGTDLIKYSTRHYAHAACLLRAKGAEFIARLPLAPQKQAQTALRDHGHTHDLDDNGRCLACGEYPL